MQKGVLSQISILWFGLKKELIIHFCQVPGKIFPAFTLNPIRPCLDWQVMGFELPNPFTTLSNLTWHEDKVRNLNKIRILPENHQLWTNSFTTNHQFTLNPIINHSWYKHTIYPPPTQCQKLLNQPQCHGAGRSPSEGRAPPTPKWSTSGQYASYWNAYLLFVSSLDHLTKLCSSYSGGGG